MKKTFTKHQYNTFVYSKEHARMYAYIYAWICVCTLCVDICIIGTHALLLLHVLLIRKGCAT